MLADKRKKFLISLKLLGKSAPFHTKILIQIRALFGIRVLDLKLGSHIRRTAYTKIPII